METNATAAVADRQPEAESWVYLGTRASGGGTRYAWRDQSGDVLFYRRLKGRVFGGLYTVQVTRSEDTISVGVDPAYSGTRADDAAAIEVRALAHEHRLASARLEKNTKRAATVDEAIEPLLKVAAGLKTYSDRAALADYVLGRIHSARAA